MANPSLDSLVAKGYLPNYQLSRLEPDASFSHTANAYENGIVAVAMPNRDSLFALLSLSKPFANLLALKLIDDGEFSYDDPLYKFLPQFRELQVLEPKDGSRRPASKPILIKHLLLHTSGFSQNTDFMGFGPIAEKYKSANIFGVECLSSESTEPIDEVITRLAALPLQKEPGEAFGYSVATDVLAAVIEVVTHNEYETVLNDKLLVPLAMRDTHMRVPQDKRHRVMQLYQPLFKTYPVPGDYQRYQPLASLSEKTVNAGMNPGCTAGGQGLVSTMSDMQKFLRFLANDLTFPDGGRFVSDATASTFFTHQLEPGLGQSPLSKSLPKTKGEGLSNGLAIHLEEKGGSLKDPSTYKYLYWTGFSGSGIWIEPKTKSGGIFITQLLGSDQFLLPEIVSN